MQHRGHGIITESQGVSDDSQVLSVSLIEREREREMRREKSTPLRVSKAAISLRPQAVETNKAINKHIDKDPRSYLVITNRYHGRWM